MQVNTSRYSGALDNPAQLLGTGSRLLTELGKTTLQVGINDTVHISQIGSLLQLLINGGAPYRLGRQESSTLEVRATNPDQVTVDESVRIPIQGVAAKVGEKAATAEAPKQNRTNGKYMQTLAGLLAGLTRSFGGAQTALPAVNGPAQLVDPMKGLMEAISKTSSRGSSGENVSNLQEMLQAFIQQILAGKSPNLSTLGTLASQVASQMPGQPAAGAQQVRPPMPPPAGMSHEEFVNLQKQIDQFIAKGDIGSMRSVANNPRFLSCATPEQKAAMAKALATDSQAHPNDVTMQTLGTNDRTEDRKAINKIAGSAGNSDEFRTIVEGAGPDLLHDAMAPSAKDKEAQSALSAKGDPKAKFPDKLAADFDTMAGAFKCSDLAANRDQARSGERAVEKGYSPQEVVSARQKFNYLQADKINGVPEDPLLASVVSTDEKAAMIYTMRHHDFRNDAKADRTIANLAMTCDGKEDYDELMAKCGNDVMSIQEPEARSKVQKLAAGYGRTDLVTDPEALKCKDVLIDPAARQKYLGGAGESQKARSVEQGKTPDDFQKTNQEYISAELERMDPVSQKETIFLNVDRAAQGKPPLNPVELRKEAQQIAESKPRDKYWGNDITEQKIKDACKQEGLSDYTARNLITQPCARAYERGGAQAAGYLSSQLGPLQDKLQQVIATKGPFSPEAKALSEQIDGIKKKMQPYVDHLNEIGGKFNNMYPPPTSAMEEVAKFFISLAEIVGPALLNLIPGVGSALYAGYQGVRAIISLIQGNFLGALGGFASVLPGLGSVLGGVLQGALGTAGNVLSKGTQLVGAALHGDVGGIISSVSGGFDVLKGIGGTAGQALGQLSTGAEILGKGASIIQGAATGDVSKIASGIGGMVDQMDNLAKTNPDVRKMFNDFQKLAPPNSTLGQIADDFGRATQIGSAFLSGNFQRISNAFSDPKLLGGLNIDMDVMKFAQTGTAFGANLQSGKVTEAFGILAASNDPVLHEAGTLFQDGNKFLNSISGDLQKTLGDAGRVMAQFAANPVIKDVAGQLLNTFRLGQLANDTGISNALLKAAQGGNPLLTDPSVAKAMEFISGSTKMIQDIASGNFSKSLGALGDSAGKLLNSKEWQDASSLLRAGGNLFQSIGNGQLQQTLSQFTSSNLVLQAAAGEVQNFAQLGSDFLSTINNPNLPVQFGSALGVAQQQFPDLAQSMRDVAGGSSILSEFADGNFNRVLNTYESQLQGLGNLVSASPFVEMEESARQFLNQGDLQQKLLQNMASFQQQRSTTALDVGPLSLAGSRV